MDKYLVLASSSPRRIELLKKYVENLIIIKPDVEEIKLDDPYKTVYVNSRNKVENVVDKAPKNSIVIGVDTIVYLPGYGVMGKPSDFENVFEYLSRLSDKIHLVISGVYILDKTTGNNHYFHVTSYVKFSKLSREDIEWYISTREPYGKAGGYAIQGYAGVFVEWVIGDFYNVVGLPLNSIWRVLKSVFGFNLIRKQ